jgi:Glycosyltransferase family 87
MYVLRGAGLAWWQGVDAYQPGVLARFVSENRKVGPFAYPPQIAPLCLLLACFSMPFARAVIVALNLASLAVIDGLQQQSWRGSARGERNWFITALILGAPFTSHVVYMGQTSLIALAACLAAWECAGRGRNVVAGLLAAVASIKPQMSMLILLWFLLERRFGLLAVSGLAVAAAAIGPALATGPLALIPTWIDAVGQYRGHMTNTVDFPQMFGLSSLLDAVNVPAAASPILAFPGFLWLWLHRRMLDRSEIVALLLAVSLLLIYAHAYDLVGLLPFVITFARLARTRREVALAGLALLAALCLPQRLLRPFGNPLLNQFRVPVVLAALLLWVSFRSSGPLAAATSDSSLGRPDAA